MVRSYKSYCTLL